MGERSFLDEFDPDLRTSRPRFHPPHLFLSIFFPDDPERASEFPFSVNKTVSWLSSSSLTDSLSVNLHFVTYPSPTPFCCDFDFRIAWRCATYMTLVTLTSSDGCAVLCMCVLLSALLCRRPRDNSLSLASTKLQNNKTYTLKIVFEEQTIRTLKRNEKTRGMGMSPRSWATREAFAEVGKVRSVA